MEDVPGSYLASMKWISLCKFFDRITNASKHSKKRELLRNLYNKFRPNDLFHLIRLLVPQHDKDRQSYGLKEKKIADTYIKVLALSPTSEDAIRLLHWKKPQRSRGESMVLHIIKILKFILTIR